MPVAMSGVLYTSFLAGIAAHRCRLCERSAAVRFVGAARAVFLLSLLVLFCIPNAAPTTATITTTTNNNNNNDFNSLSSSPSSLQDTTCALSLNFSNVQSTSAADAAAAAAAPRPLRRRAAGVLAGLGPQTPVDTGLAPLRLHTLRNPGRGPLPWRCDARGCPTPLTLLPVLARARVERAQIILGPQLIEVACVAAGRNLSTECPLPGAPGDADMGFWLDTVDAFATELLRRGLDGKVNQSTTTAPSSGNTAATAADDAKPQVVLDIWNEPNFAGHPGTGGGGFSQNYTGFFAVWHATVRLLRRRLPQTVIVGPSAAPVPVGPNDPPGWPGWAAQSHFLQSFLAAAHAADTLPNVLTWHDYTGSPGAVAGQAAAMRSYMTAQLNIVPPLPVALNEHTPAGPWLVPGYVAAMLMALERTGVDHAVRGCWSEPSPSPSPSPSPTSSGGGGGRGGRRGTGVYGSPPISTCFDDSLNALLAPEAAFASRAAWWPTKWYGQLPGSTDMADAKSLVSSSSPSSAYVAPPAKEVGSACADPSTDSGPGFVHVLAVVAAAAAAAAGSDIENYHHNIDTHIAPINNTGTTTADSSETCLVHVLLAHSNTSAPATQVTLELSGLMDSAVTSCKAATAGEAGLAGTATALVVEGATPAQQNGAYPAPKVLYNATRVQTNRNGVLALPSVTLQPGAAARIALVLAAGI